MGKIYLREIWCDGSLSFSEIDQYSVKEIKLLEALGCAVSTKHGFHRQEGTFEKWIFIVSMYHNTNIKCSPLLIIFENIIKQHKNYSLIN